MHLHPFSGVIIGIFYNFDVAVAIDSCTVTITVTVAAISVDDGITST
jgi:hypothetical protein